MGGSFDSASAGLLPGFFADADDINNAIDAFARFVLRHGLILSRYSIPPARSVILAVARSASQPRRERQQAQTADDNAPPREQCKAVASDVTKQCLHHEPAAYERDRKPDGDDQRIAAGELRSAFISLENKG